MPSFFKFILNHNTLINSILAEITGKTVDFLKYYIDLVSEFHIKETSEAVFVFSISVEEGGIKIKAKNDELNLNEMVVFDVVCLFSALLKFVKSGDRKFIETLKIHGNLREELLIKKEEQ